MRDRLTDVAGVVYGTSVQGRLPADFQAYLLPGEADPRDPARTLTVTYGLGDDLLEMEEVEEIWESEPGNSDTPGRLTLSRWPQGGFGLTICGEERGHLRCTEEMIEIRWSGSASGAAHHLFAYGLPLWLETRGIPVLHGSAVAFEGRAVGFLGPTGVGKSVLCAELVELGCGFLADDGLALQRGRDGAWRALPGPPMLRLWPTGLAGRLEIEPGTLPKVIERGDKRRLGLEPGVWKPLPVAALYLLRRRRDPETPIQQSWYAPREALLRLLEHGVAASPASALGLAGQRLELLADVAENVPVGKLSYPSGADSAERILATMYKTPSRSKSSPG